MVVGRLTDQRKRDAVGVKVKVRLSRIGEVLKSLKGTRIMPRINNSEAARIVCNGGSVEDLSPNQEGEDVLWNGGW